MENKKMLDIKPFALRKILFDLGYVVIFASFISFLKPFGMDKVGYLYGWMFWLTICICGLAIYSPTIYLCRLSIAKKYPHKAISLPWQVFIGAFVASCMMALVAPVIISLYFDSPASYWHLVNQSFITSLFIGGVITIVVSMKGYMQEQKQMILIQQETIDSNEPNLAEQALTNFMKKIPQEKRGELLCLEMDDHYLKVHTDKGCHMLLLRFKDALVQLEHVEGMQTHRSWWVAQSAIVGSKRVGRKWLLELKNTIEVPVSQTYLAQIKPFL